jgi:hypothetical protein
MPIAPTVGEAFVRTGELAEVEFAILRTCGLSLR